MPQIKRFTAKKDFALDCGHTARSGEGFVVTSLFSCEKDGRWLQAIGKASFREAVAKLHEEMNRAGLDGKPVDQR